MRIQRVPAAVIVLSIAIGCADGGEEPDDGILYSGELAGALQLDGFPVPSELYFVGGFFASVTPSDVVISLPTATEQCVADSGVQELDFIFRRVGNSISATSTASAFTVTATAEPMGAPFYEGVEPGPFPLGAYSINAGSTSLGTIVVPPRVVRTNPGAPIVPGEPLDLTFTPNTGARYVRVTAEDANELFSYTCYSADDGSFTLPGEVTAAIGSDGTIDIESGGTLQIADFQGKKLLLNGFNH